MLDFVNNYFYCNDMKRLLIGLGCLMTIVGGMSNAACIKTDSPWERGEVYAPAGRETLELEVVPAWVLPRADVLSINYLPDGKAEVVYVTHKHRVMKESIHF